MDDILNFDIKDSIPHIIDAYAEVYGIEHKDLIKQRMRRNIYVIYNNVDGIENYMWFLKDCKQKELAIKFLNKIGIDTSKFKQESYAEDLNENISKVIEVFIGNYRNIEPMHSMFATSGINAWTAIDEETKLENVEQKVKFLNILRGKNAELITKETYEDFCNTNEYNKILQKIEKYKKVYEQTIEEYEEYEKTLEPYKKYVQEEKSRNEDIQAKKRTILYRQIESILPNNVKNFLNNKYSSIKEKSKAFLGKNFETLEGVNIGEKSYLEFFSRQDEDKLNDISIDENYKRDIYYFRTKYFEQMGIKTDKQLSNFKNSKEYYEYLTKQEDVKKLIIPPQIVDEITKLRTNAYEETQKEFIYNSKDFIENTKQLDENDKKIMYEIQRGKIEGTGAGTKEGKFSPIVILSIKEGYGGDIARLVVHEIGHSIETEETLNNNWRTGFERISNDTPINPYNNKKRKYERFNETIRDMLVIEANEVLHKKGIYLFEPKEIVKDSKDRNTSNICKSLLTQFLGKYRKEVINVLLFGDMESLYNKVGEENFEELVDILNKVDSLEKCQELKLTEKIENNEKEHSDVIEYQKQLERLEKVYDNMEKYTSKEEILDILNSAIQATEEKTRMGQIQGVKEKLKETSETTKKEGKDEDLYKRDL